MTAPLSRRALSEGVNELRLATIQLVYELHAGRQIRLMQLKEHHPLNDGRKNGHYVEQPAFQNSVARAVILPPHAADSCVTVTSLTLASASANMQRSL